MTSDGVDAGFVEGEFGRGGGAAGGGAGFDTGNANASGCGGNVTSVACDVAGTGAAAPVGGTLTVLMGIGRESTCWCS